MIKQWKIRNSRERKLVLVFDNRDTYIHGWKKTDLTFKNYQTKLYIKSLNKLNKSLINKTKSNVKKYIVKLKIKGVGLKAYRYRNSLILDYNQKHWFLIKLFSKLNVYIKKNVIYLYSTEKSELLRIVEIIIKNRRFNYYKGKGFLYSAIDKLRLKKNEKKNYS